MKDLNKFINEIHELAQEKGFYKNPRQPLESLMLVVSELSEAAEELRKGHHASLVYYEGEKPEGFMIELADAIIRILDLCGYYRLDIGWALEEKHNYNKTRPYMHGKKL